MIAVPIFKRLGLGSVLGYLAAGMVIGPWGLRLIGDPQTVLHFAEFGVVLLLFLIGLELEPQRAVGAAPRDLRHGRARRCSRRVAAVAGDRAALGLPLAVALVAGMGFAMSSTAIGARHAAGEEPARRRPAARRASRCCCSRTSR